MDTEKSSPTPDNFSLWRVPKSKHSVFVIFLSREIGEIGDRQLSRVIFTETTLKLAH